jgi:hypothetical protein
VTPKTRRRVFLSLLMLILTLPAEFVLLKALQSPDDQTAAREWVEQLGAAELTSAADRIQAYSFTYRREIMRALPADGRASVWRKHIDQYLGARSELDPGAVEVLRAAQRVLTADALADNGSAAARDALHAAALNIEAVLGREAAAYVAHDLGPTSSRFASADPLILKLASFAREQFTVLARLPDCDCADDGGCGYYETYCSTSQSCRSDNSWPMCGYFWNTPCNGLCTAY